MKILGASIGDCVHIQGVYNFLRKAEEYGHSTIFLGPAQSADELIDAIKRGSPDAVAISYRLTPENGRAVLDHFARRIEQEGLNGLQFLFGGTPPMAEIAHSYGLFRLVSDGENDETILSYLSAENGEQTTEIPPQALIKRILWKRPEPLLRTHFGLPQLAQTTAEIRRIADSRLIDVISLGTDQEAQANFFHPERQKTESYGAGGVPVRSLEEFEELYHATRQGNFPLMRTYAGTDDLIRLAELYKQAFGNAWAAVPIFWFNQMDRRGPHSLEQSIAEHFKLIKWNAERDIPVEILEAHHWGMRWAHDALQVATAYLGAAIAKRLGTKSYVHQYMFNTPAETSFSNDLAKMLAVRELIEELAREEPNFNVYHQTRTGLPSFPNSLEAAKAQLATSTLLQMQLSPDIIHVVSYCEAHHAATAEDIIDSAVIVNQAIKNAKGNANMIEDPRVQRRKKQLMEEALLLFEYITRQGDITDPKFVASLVSSGLLDAPMLRSNDFARGRLRTGFFDGGCYALDDANERQTERERIEELKRIGGI